MSYYSDGNLARQVVRPQPYVLPEYDGREEERQRAERQRRLQQEAAIRRQYKAAGRLHARTVTRLLLVFLLVGSVAGFVTWRSAKLTEMSFLNAGLQRQIGQLDKENSLIQDKITTKASMQTTREMAASRLGMQKVTSEQIRYVSSVYFRAEIEIPDGGGYLAGQNLSEAEWLAAIETWVKNH